MGEMNIKVTCWW